MKITSIILPEIFLTLAVLILVAVDGNAQDVNNPKIIWGQITNIMVGDINVSGTFGHLNLIPASIRAGIGVPNSNDVIVVSLHKKVIYPAYMCYELVSTNSAISNKFIEAFLPRRGEQFVLNMTDTNDMAVSKTAKGLTIGKPDSLKPNTRDTQVRRNGYFSSTMWPGIDDPHLQPLDPTEYFALENPGLYKLTFVQRLYVIDTNVCLETITLPPVTVDVRVEK